MKHGIWTGVLSAALALAMLGCDDDAVATIKDVSTDGSPVGDMAELDGGAGGMKGDMAPDQGPTPDMEADMNVVVPDMMVPDMAIPDMALPPMCEGQPDNNEACGNWQRCLDNVCEYDLRPQVYRMINAHVIEPEVAQGSLEFALSLAINTNALNLLIEPGDYADGRYRIYIGNGQHQNNTYTYLNQYPIQNIWGTWALENNDPERPVWSQDGEGAFVLNVPAGFAMAEGMEVRCFTLFSAVTQSMVLRPSIDPETNEPTLTGEVVGYLLRSDIERVDFRQGGNIIHLIDFFNEEPPSLDTDGDGTPDSYPIQLEITATATTFVGEAPHFSDGSPDPDNRDPNASVPNPPECDERD